MKLPREPCECGCGGVPKTSIARFLPGHDSRVRVGDMTMCAKGLHPRTEENHYKGNKSRGWECLACRKARYGSWYRRNTDKASAAGRRGRWRYRKLAFDHYGWTCACCGEADYRFLGIDHINGGGRQSRLGAEGGQTARWAYAQFRDTGVWPDDLQTFCHNCNQAKHYNMHCPHRMPVEMPGQLALFGSESVNEAS